MSTATLALPILPLIQRQPEPVGLIVDHTYSGEECMTSIVREWEGDDGQRCRLCPLGQCRLTQRGTCLVNVPWYVPEESAPLFGFAGV